MFLATWLCAAFALPPTLAVSARHAVAQSVLLAQMAPLVHALSGLRGRQAGGRVGASSSFGSDQVPGPTPRYVDYGKPEFTTFDNVTSACKACVEFWPAQEDGERFHAKVYDDPDGGVWARSCRAGKCDFRDPQTEPVGGVVGHGTGPGGKPDGKFCITRDPVPWYSECEPVILESTSSVLDVTRYCSYREQIFIPPPAGEASRWQAAGGGKPQAWARIGKAEQCLGTIQKQGAALLDDMSFCDSDLPALSGCCETVYSALTCVAETSDARGFARGDGVFSTMSSKESKTMFSAFEKYCVPLCQNNKKTFCELYPKADICVTPADCTNCTSKGGLWCPKLESCHCPGPKPPCIAPPATTPAQCLPAKPAKKTSVAPAKVKKAEGGGGHDDKALCKYAEMARNWKTDA